MLELYLKTNGITIVSLIYLILIFILYYLKGRNNRLSSKIFTVILYTTFIIFILYSLWSYFAITKNSLENIIGRITLFSVICWDLIQAFYISFVFRDDDKNDEILKKHKYKFIILGVILFILNLVFSFVFEYNSYQISANGAYYMDGFLNSYMKIVTAVTIIYSIIIASINHKKVDRLTNYLFFIVIFVCGAEVLLSVFNLIKLNDNAFLGTMIILFTYLSVESQDRNLLNEYNLSIKKSNEFNELKSNFMKNISQQIRMSFGVIVGMGEHVITNDNISEDEVRSISLDVENASESLLNLVNSIFDLSRIESGKEIINNEIYYLDNIIYDISSSINSKIKNNLVFTINADEICPNELVGDGYKLCKILNIIILNAINHTKYGEVSLNVSCIQVDSLNYEFTFLIKNNGHSMSDEMFSISYEDIVKMNDIDYNAVNLVVSKRLLGMIGGNIEFINEAGKGTQYVIKLKQKLHGQNRIGNIKTKIQTNYDSSHKIINLLGKKVLVVDQEKSNVELLSRYLAQYNLIVDSSFDINDCNNLINSNDYDLIFINNNINGLNLYNKNIKVIGLVDKISNVNFDYFDKLEFPLEFSKLNKIINNIFKQEEVK